MSMKLRILLSIVLLFAFFGCSKQETVEQQSPSAHSSFSKTKAIEVAKAWASVDNLKVGEAEPSGSMLKVFDSTSIMLLEKIGPNDSIGIGDILTYTDKELNKNISHRLIKINSDGTLVFKGDNLPNEDPVVQRSSVTYRVVGIIYTNGK